MHLVFEWGSYIIYHAYHRKYTSSSQRLGVYHAMYGAKALSFSTSLLIFGLFLQSSEFLTKFLFHHPWGSDAFMHQGWEFSDVICNISKVHISISKSLSTMANDLQPLLQSALLNACQRLLMSQKMASPTASCSSLKDLSLTPLPAARFVSWALFSCRDGGNLIPWHFWLEVSPLSLVMAEKNLFFCDKSVMMLPI